MTPIPLNTPCIVGIDPGRTGAMAVLAVQDFKLIHLADFIPPADNLAALKSVLVQHDIKAAFLEHVHAMPKNGSVSMFNFGENYGWWKGVLDALLIPTIGVDPRKWQNHFGLVKTPDNSKPSLSFCREHFPTADLRRKKDNGRSDALCIAAFGVDWIANLLETINTFPDIGCPSPDYYKWAEEHFPRYA